MNSFHERDRKAANSILTSAYMATSIDFRGFWAESIEAGLFRNHGSVYARSESLLQFGLGNGATCQVPALLCMDNVTESRSFANPNRRLESRSISGSIIKSPLFPAVSIVPSLPTSAYISLPSTYPLFQVTELCVLSLLACCLQRVLT